MDQLNTSLRIDDRDQGSLDAAGRASSMSHGIQLLLFFVYLFQLAWNGEAAAASAASSSRGRSKVCIVGAGVTGIAAAKAFADYRDEFDIVVFDRNSDVGGLWIYTDSQDLDEHNLPVHSSMYYNLRTNLPKDLMSYPDYRQFSGENRSCVSHKTIVQYLRNYTDYFDLRGYMKFDTLVEKIRPIVGGSDDDWRTTRWSIKTRDLNSNVSAETTCNAVVVCNGHYTKPRVPQIPGIESFPGLVMHSHIYRYPQEFAGKNVLVLGAAVSGIDISIDISRYARRVYLSHNKDRIKSQLPLNIVQVPGVASVNGSIFTLRDNSTVKVDAVVFCTGYVYDLPFLDESSGLKIDDNYVKPLYKYMLNGEHPSMAFVGLALDVALFPLVDVQTKYFVALMRDKVKLPGREVRLAESLPKAKQGDQLSEKEKKYAHALGAKQWTYQQQLAQEADFEAPPDFYRQAYNMWSAYRKTDLLHYKDGMLRVNKNGAIEIIHPAYKQFEV
ncbi:flavin-containing monooxygenase FMO GS-OX-like 4 isoform X1 [Trichogramma pretiosum]|uniref:flavin-containing monooxygenase FMO GS-OX-like 4 isoform X1 n=1 Tax=Trichogramma pretiosum TaxID=7493 RepID=UPI0006C9864F|nr:flavin-containing monooxygenase FMO GS-OX-like 4 isoform X1 [Trichogramma pretiosum]